MKVSSFILTIFDRRLRLLFKYLRLNSSKVLGCCIVIIDYSFLFV